MPEIPRYERQYTAPAKSAGVPLESGTGEHIGKGLEGLGAGMDKLATALIETAERQKRHDLINFKSEIETRVIGDLAVYEQEELQRLGDAAYKSTDRINEFEKKTLEKYSTGVADPDRSKIINNVVRRRVAGIRGTIASHEAKQRHAVTMGTWDNYVSALATEVARQPDRVDDAVNSIVKEADIRVAEKLFDSVTAAKLSKDATTRLYKASLNRLVTDDPTLAIAYIKAGKYEGRMEAEVINAFRDKAKDLEKSKEEDTKRQIEAIKKGYEDERKQRVQDYLDEADKLLYPRHGKKPLLTVYDIDAKRDMFRDAGEQHHYRTLRKNAEEAWEKYTKGEGEGSGNSDTYFDIYQTIADNPDDVANNKAKIRQNRSKLTNKQYDKLMQKAIDRENAHENKDVVHAISFIRKMVNPKGSAFGSISEEKDTLNEAKAIEYFERKLDAIKKSGTPVTRELLFDLKVDVAEKFARSVGDRMLDVGEIGSSGKNNAVTADAKPSNWKAKSINTTSSAKNYFLGMSSKAQAIAYRDQLLAAGWTKKEIAEALKGTQWDESQKKK